RRDLLLLALVAPHGLGPRQRFFGFLLALLDRLLGRLGGALLVLDLGQGRLRLAGPLDRLPARLAGFACCGFFTLPRLSARLRRRLLALPRLAGCLRRRLLALARLARRTRTRLLLPARLLGRLLLGHRVEPRRLGRPLSGLLLGPRRGQRLPPRLRVGNFRLQLAPLELGLSALAPPARGRRRRAAGVLRPPAPLPALSAAPLARLRGLLPGLVGLRAHAHRLLFGQLGGPSLLGRLPPHLLQPRRLRLRSSRGLG